MAKRTTPPPQPAALAAARIRRGYFECRYGQLHVHQAIPAGGGFEEGTPVLALHAAPFSGRMFAGLLSRIGQNRSAFAPDLPGFGASDAAATLSLAEHTAAIGDFIELMRLRQIDVVGCGFGALVALELAATRPAVRRVVIAALPIADMGDQPQSAELAEAYVLHAWSGARADCGPDAPLASTLTACAERLLNGAQAAAAAAAEREYPLRERLRQTAQPLLLLHSSEWPGGFGALIEDLPAHSRRPLPGGVALFESAPQSIAAAIQDFLNA
jgi:pimeloyl-ACP methyl ester carboxylesterase